MVKIDPVVYQVLLIVGVVLFCAPAFFIHKRGRAAKS